MDSSDGDGQQRPGLRERKKEKTRQLIQQAAVRLFEERGYQDTSIQAIADAVEVSPATVVRYFPEKSDLVIYDDLDEQLIDAVRAQPPEVNVLQAVRNAVRDVFGRLGERDVEVWRGRERLMWAEPELRAAMLQDLIRTEREMVAMAGISPAGIARIVRSYEFDRQTISRYRPGSQQGHGS